MLSDYSILTVRCLELLLILWGVSPHGGTPPVLSPLHPRVLTLLIIKLIEPLPWLLHHHSLFASHISWHVINHAWPCPYRTYKLCFTLFKFLIWSTIARFQVWNSYKHICCTTANKHWHLIYCAKTSNLILRSFQCTKWLKKKIISNQNISVKQYGFMIILALFKLIRLGDHHGNIPIIMPGPDIPNKSPMFPCCPDIQPCICPFICLPPYIRFCCGIG